MKKIKVTKNDLRNLHAIFEQIDNKIMNKDYIEFCFRNKKLTEVENELLETQFKKTEEEQAYLESEWTILNKYGIRDKNGNLRFPVIVPSESEEEFNAEYAKLQKENEETYNKLIEKNEEEATELAKEIEIELHTIDFEKVPDEIVGTAYNLLRECELIIVK